jgi:hypothetical protein
LTGPHLAAPDVILERTSRTKVEENLGHQFAS